MNANSKSNDKFNPWNYLIQGVPQESIHDPVLFLIHLNFLGGLQTCLEFYQ